MYSTLENYHSLLSGHVVMKQKESYKEEQIVFLSFANENYKNSMARIKDEVKRFPFSKVITYDEYDLKNMSDFWNIHGSFVEQNKRGYGYWLWKPYLVYKTLSTLKDGDRLVYADAGASFGSDIHQFNEIVAMSSRPSGVVSWSLPYLENQWTKQDLVEYLNASHVMESTQLHATFFVLRRCEAVLSLVKKWYETASIYHLLDDSPSAFPNHQSFNEHRHDQSIFSLLRKIHGTEISSCHNVLIDSKTRG
jgi:hypothetical protein